MISGQELAEERQYFRLLWQYVKRHRWNLFLTIIMLIITTVLTVSAPIFFNRAMEIVERFSRGTLEGDVIGVLVLSLIYYFLLTVLSWFSSATIVIFSTRMNAGIIGDLRQDAFESVLLNNMTFFDTTQSGNTVSILTADLNELYETGAAIAEVITSMMQLIGILAVLAFYSIPLTLASLAILPFFFFVTLLIRRYRRTAESNWRSNFGKVNQSFAETLRSIEVSKAFHREEDNVDRFKIMNERTYRASIKRGAAIFISQPVGDFLRNILLIIILALGSFLVSTQGLSVAHFYLFIFLLDFYYQPVRSVARNYTRFQSLFANLERVLGVTYNTLQTERDKGGTLQDFSGHLTFDNVSFSYDGTTPVLENISFEIKPQQRVALVGHTGSGKTTIASLVGKLYTISSGDILFDDTSQAELSPASIRSSIRMVSQDVLLFKGTIRDNLRFANPDATDEELWQAIDAVQAREFIDLLPDGLDSAVDEDAGNLSTGQRQMLAFARTILSRPKLIILDEATSAVDLYTEAKIQESTDLLLENTTSLVIAHRLTTIIRSDLIVVLDGGRVIETGSHDELMALNGSYREMYDLYFQTQSAHYLETIRTK
ncbi:MAG: ABC transporter ATP-binding protein [Candidatus Kariarchaeaceae archaeon]|jgi:ATP-binding cassette subfamily B protein